MRKYCLKVRYHKVFKANQSKKRIEENVKPNLVRRNFNVDRINQVWSTDITYIIYNGKRAYLSSIMDLYSRNIISYKISYRMDNKLVMDTLNEAIRKQNAICLYKAVLFVRETVSACRLYLDFEGFCQLFSKRIPLYFTVIIPLAINVVCISAFAIFSSISATFSL